MEAEIANVECSEPVVELKTGVWKKQFNNLSDGTFEVEVYWDPDYMEATKPDHWGTHCGTIPEAESVYNQLTSMYWVKKLLKKDK